MSRRARAIGFAAAAALCAGLAAGATGGVESGGAEQYGALREVVVAAETLAAGDPLGRTVVGEALEIRRVPESFVPPDALASPAQALGRRPATTIPAGGYLLGSQFEAPPSEANKPAARLRGGRTPVEIAVEGAGALGAGAGGGKWRVDVIVTTEASPGGGAGRTFVAAESVGLLDLRPAGGEPTDALPGAPPTEAWIATLALTRGQALRLIHAQSFAREVRLIGG